MNRRRSASKIRERRVAQAAALEAEFNVGLRITARDDSEGVWATCDICKRTPIKAWRFKPANDQNGDIDVCYPCVRQGRSKKHEPLVFLGQPFKWLNDRLKEEALQEVWDDSDEEAGRDPQPGRALRPRMNLSLDTVLQGADQRRRKRLQDNLARMNTPFALKHPVQLTDAAKRKYSCTICGRAITAWVFRPPPSTSPDRPDLPPGEAVCYPCKVCGAAEPLEPLLFLGPAFDRNTPNAAINAKEEAGSEPLPPKFRAALQPAAGEDDEITETQRRAYRACLQSRYVAGLSVSDRLCDLPLDYAAGLECAPPTCAAHSVSRRIALHQCRVGYASAHATPQDDGDDDTASSSRKTDSQQQPQRTQPGAADRRQARGSGTGQPGGSKIPTSVAGSVDDAPAPSRELRRLIVRGEPPNAAETRQSVESKRLLDDIDEHTQRMQLMAASRDVRAIFRRIGELGDLLDAIDAGETYRPSPWQRAATNKLHERAAVLLGVLRGAIAMADAYRRREVLRGGRFLAVMDDDGQSMMVCSPLASSTAAVDDSAKQPAASRPDVEDDHEWLQQLATAACVYRSWARVFRAGWITDGVEAAWGVSSPVSGNLLTEMPPSPSEPTSGRIAKLTVAKVLPGGRVAEGGEAEAHGVSGVPSLPPPSPLDGLRLLWAAEPAAREAAGPSPCSRPARSS